MRNGHDNTKRIYLFTIIKMIKILELTLKQYMGLNDIKVKDFKNPTTLSNIFNGGKNIGKFNKDYVWDKKYFPSNKSVWIIAETLGLSDDDTKKLIANQLAK